MNQRLEFHLKRFPLTSEIQQELRLHHKGKRLYLYKPLCVFIVTYPEEASSSKMWVYARERSRVVNFLPPDNVANSSSGRGSGC